MNRPGTICVTGRGLIRLKPDTMRVTITLEGVESDHAKTLARSSSETERIRAALADAGFLREDLKTVQFRVEPEYEGYQEQGVYRQRFVGFRSRHELKIEFPFDNDRLGGVFSAIAEAKLSPELSVAYTVRDREAAKNALLGLAVADARAKAEALTAASGVKLLGVRHIRYAMNENEFAVHPIACGGVMRKMSADSFSPEIVPEEIEAEDTVTIVWEIE